jgi:hypothetical protein
MNAEEAEKVKHLADAFEDAVAEAAELGERVERIADTTQVIRRQGWSNIAVLIVVFLMAVACVKVVYDINDCTSPSGKCAKRGAQQTQKAVVKISQKGELLRNATELDRAKEQGNQADIDFRSKKVAEYLSQLGCTRIEEC